LRAVTTARPRLVNIARPNSALVNAVRVNQVNVFQASACWVWRPTKPNGASITLKRHNYIDVRGRFNLMHKTYGLVITDDYSRYTWVFFLASKNETTGILKKFITEIENLVDKKVKAEAVNTACYVQNMVLVVKPHNKTPYELFRGKTPAQSFMRLFGCHVTILNTLDHLGKFNRKFDDGFFVGYSLNGKAFMVYNLRTRKVEENLHIRFLEDKPSIAGNEPKWLFDIDVLTKSINYVLVVADGSLFDSTSKNASNDEPRPSSDVGHKDDEGNASNDEPRPSSDVGHKDDEGVSKKSEIDDQEKSKNSTQDVNTIGPSINTVSTNDNTEVDMSNITTTYQVPNNPNTRIHKDHSFDHVIGDVQSGVLTRSKLKPTNEQGVISAVYEGKTHEDLNTCLFACFLSQIEPTRVAKALSNPVWVEVMQ
nr:hypothetical protein [Tanacetum cinerariifolium]